MRRLIGCTDPQDTERGAAGVIVGLTMMALIGVGAVAVDVGQIYAERAQLQNGADAGALAVARSCATGPCTSALAGPLANANSNDNASAASVDLSVAGQVTVTTSTKNGGSSFLSKMFANALNSGPVTVGAQATATWGSPGSGPAALPLTFAPCQFDVDGSLHTILTHGSETCASDSPSGGVIPGGFEWLLTNPGDCATTVFADDPATAGITDPYAMTKTGLSMPSECKPLIEGYLNTVVMFPVFSTASGTGANAKYYIKGYAAFLLVGYSFPGMTGGDLTGLSGSDRGIRGRFVSWVADPTKYGGGGYTGGGVDLPPKLIK
ncbi:TadE/TadG family type IV pilus assembly protein [Arthrobacter sp. TB 26]|uniref:TadE/TadG family type IV pilus assembly protein n=1 Tax=Arthrobacter sp. TB 26 TaxID=494420 RepID=UPI000462D3B3|nr:TadE/TadG family type IV pilus assembly protein [Arthrobacter sp. TB 26]